MQSRTCTHTHTRALHFWRSFTENTTPVFGSTHTHTRAHAHAHNFNVHTLVVTTSGFEFRRDDLRYVRDLGEGEFGQVVLMNVIGGVNGIVCEL